MSPHGGPPVFMAFFFGLYGFFILLALALFVVWIIELVDVVRREFPGPNDKMIWVLVVVLGHGIGALVYYFIGKQQGWLPGEGPASIPKPPPPPTTGV